MKRAALGVIPLGLAVLWAALAGAAASSQDVLDSAVRPAEACGAARPDVAGACAPADVPTSAFSNGQPYGRGWECRWGHRLQDGACIALAAPDNAYIDASGTRWRCDRGYREAEGACLAIRVPENGFLTDASFGRGWECERGYRAVGDDCEAILVPANGFLDGNSYGSGWRCERGFRPAGDRCDAVVPPENAHLDYSGADWECDRPFQRRDDVCVAP